ncbi:MAG: GtrA family protein [Desulfuromonas sp.]
MKSQLSAKAAPRSAGGVFSDLAKYLLASVVGTTAHYGLMLLLIRGFAANVVLASTCGALTGAVIVYVLNYFFTFRCQKNHVESMAKFFLLAAAGAGVNGLVLNTAVEYLEWSVPGAQLLATAIVFSLNFTLNRAWTF